MPIVNLKDGVIDKLIVLWSLCLIVHYRETNRKICKNNIVADFNEYIWEIFESACDMAINRKLITYHMQLTPKGQVACDNWQEISARLYAI